MGKVQVLNKLMEVNVNSIETFYASNKNIGVFVSIEWG